MCSLKRIEHEHPYRGKILLKDNTFKKFIKILMLKNLFPQDLPTLYCTSGALYARKYSLKNLRRFNLGKKPCGVVIDDFESVILIDDRFEF